MNSFELTITGRPNTERVQKSLFRNHISQVSKEKAQNWGESDTLSIINRWAIEQNLKPRTVQCLLNLLARYIKWCGGPVLDTKSHSRKIGRMRQEREVNALNKDQAETLMKTCKRENRDFYPILLCGLHAGLRRGEVFGLAKDDIDPTKNRLVVRRSYDGPTKNGRSRIVPISSELSYELLRINKNPLFNRIDPNPSLRRLCRSIGLKAIRFHDLRHTFATLALESGVYPKQVQQWLGHSNLTTTLDIYWQSTDQEADMSFLPGRNT